MKLDSLLEALNLNFNSKFNLCQSCDSDFTTFKFKPELETSSLSDTLSG